MFYPSDTKIIMILLNIYEHIKRNYDYVLIVTGDTGTGKSMFALQLLETWYKIILKREITPDLIKNVNVKYEKWARRFKDLNQYDMNIFDEGSIALDSKDAMTRLSKDISKMFNVMRVKGVFSVIVLPSFFNLNKYFRENRLRGVAYIDKRGHYKYYSKTGVLYLNVYNATRLVKNMNVARPIHTANYPDYNGVLRSAYDKIKISGVDEIIKEVVDSYVNDKHKYTKVADIIRDDVLKLYEAKNSQTYIANKLNTSVFTVNKIVQQHRLAQKD